MTKWLAHVSDICMKNQADTAHIDEILEPWKAVIGRDYAGYRNHAVRMATFSLMLHPCSPHDQRKTEIAACFHDIGIWTDDTLDYLSPSVHAALRYLEERGLSDWGQEISEMILEHHKIRAVKGGFSPLVELFRKGDLVDVSKGLVRFGLSGKAVRDVMRMFPNAGFHLMLIKRGGKWLFKHPFNPLPMMKW